MILKEHSYLWVIIIWYGNYSAVLSLSTQPPLNRSMSLKRENKHVVILLYYIFKDKNRNRRSYPVFERFGNLRFDSSCSTRLDRERSREKGRNDSTKSTNYILSRNIIFNKRNNFLPISYARILLQFRDSASQVYRNLRVGISSILICNLNRKAISRGQIILQR